MHQRRGELDFGNSFARSGPTSRFPF